MSYLYLICIQCKRYKHNLKENGTCDGFDYDLVTDPPESCKWFKKDDPIEYTDETEPNDP